MSHIHPSRSAMVPSEPPRKKRKVNPHASRPDAKMFKKAHPTNGLKSTIRSLKRLLENREDLPATVRIDKERELQTAERELEQTNQAQQKSDLITRWHKVRFFDRQKATKRLKRAEKKLESFEEGKDGGPKARARLEEGVKDWQTAVNYAIYYPLDIAYVPMFPNHKQKIGKEKNAELVREEDEAMFKMVRQSMEEGTLEALRNGKLTAKAAAEEEVSQMATIKESKKDKGKGKLGMKRDKEDKSKKRRAPEPENEEDSDGEFFE